MVDIEAHQLSGRNGHGGRIKKTKSAAESGHKYDLPRTFGRGGRILCG